MKSCEIGTYYTETTVAADQPVDLVVHDLDLGFIILELQQKT